MNILKDKISSGFSPYGLFFALGIAVSAIVALLICKIRKTEKYEIVYSGVFAMVGAIVGAKLLFLLVSIKLIYETHPNFFDLMRGGFVFYGGLIGGMAGLYLYIKKYRLDAKNFFDIFAVVTPLGHAVGRIGCFFGGCCYGIVHEGFPSHTYSSAAGNAPLGVPLLPIQLIEAGCLLLLFIIELFLFIKFKYKKGLESLVYIISYPIIRFITEFFRGDLERGKFCQLSTSQWVSLILIFFVLLYEIISRRKNKMSSHI
ncbi:MAG: prolipoprotein diacylglyceryl transferase [Eubacteriales bacterium]